MIIKDKDKDKIIFLHDIKHGKLSDCIKYTKQKSLLISELSQEDLDAICNSKAPKEYDYLDDELLKED